MKGTVLSEMNVMHDRRAKRWDKGGVKICDFRENFR